MIGRQRLIERLTGHPWFAISALAASERSAGKTYAEAASWRLGDRLPVVIADQVVRRCDPAELDERSEQHPEVVEALRARIEEMLAAARARPGAGGREDIDPRVRERLEELGYVD